MTKTAVRTSGQPHANDVDSFLNRLPLARGKWWIGLIMAVLLSAAAVLIRFEVDPWLPAGFPFLTFFPAVILTAFLFGTRAGILAGVLSGLSSWYFFIPPFGSLALPGDAAVAMLFYAGVIGVDIALVHLMQRANARLVEERERGLELVRHRDLLFSELQHRVGNNLQMSASLLQLQKRKLAEPEARAAIDEAARRLGMIGRVQRQLYDPTGAQLDLPTFLDQLAQDVVSSSGHEGVTCRVHADSGLKLSPDAAIPTALIVAEAVSNAIEHGFESGRDGRIDITVRQLEQRLHLIVQDNGKGIKDLSGEPAAEVVQPSLGLRICTMLAQGLQGEFRLQPGDAGGTRAVLEMPYA